LRPAPPGPPPAGIDRCRSLLSYDGDGRELIARLKYRNARSALPWLATGMAALVASSPIDVVTWAPTSGDRRRRRGFDQAELLARATAGALGGRCRALLARGPGPPQTGRSREERWRGPTFAVGRRGPCPATVLLVDDLLTTGATLAAAARALRAAGTTTVIAVTAGRTPLKVTVSTADP
jgi:predicted amidophosphoribosyltransferase